MKDKKHSCKQFSEPKQNKYKENYILSHLETKEKKDTLHTGGKN